MGRSNRSKRVIVITIIVAVALKPVYVDRLTFDFWRSCTHEPTDEGGGGVALQEYHNLTI